MGSSYLLSDLLAAFLCAQLERYQAIQARRRQIWEYYQAHLADWARRREIALPVVPAHCEQSFHMFYLMVPSLELRRSLIAHLTERQIVSVFHYLPLHLSEMGRRFGGKVGDCPVTESVSDRLLRLPFFNEITEEQQARVVSALMEWGDRALGASGGNR
jgi:dTDP-4-amino-4,6-dideoxygalactose transaminase